MRYFIAVFLADSLDLHPSAPGPVEVRSFSQATDTARDRSASKYLGCDVVVVSDNDATSLIRIYRSGELFSSDAEIAQCYRARVILALAAAKPQGGVSKRK